MSDNNSNSSEDKKIGRPCKYKTEEERKTAKYAKSKQYNDKFKLTRKDYYCEVCNTTLDYYAKYKHFKSNKHMDNTNNQ